MPNHDGRTSFRIVHMTGMRKDSGLRIEGVKRPLCDSRDRVQVFVLKKEGRLGLLLRDTLPSWQSGEALGQRSTTILVIAKIPLMCLSINQLIFDASLCFRNSVIVSSSHAITCMSHTTPMPSVVSTIIFLLLSPEE